MFIGIRTLAAPSQAYLEPGVLVVGCHSPPGCWTNKRIAGSTICKPGLVKHNDELMLFNSLHCQLSSMFLISFFIKPITYTAFSDAKIA